MEIATQSPVIKRVEFYAALLVTILVVWLHLTRMTHAGGLWRDEAGAAQVALMPSLHELWNNQTFESFPPLWPLLLRGCGLLGLADSDASIRVLLKTARLPPTAIRFDRFW